PTQALGSVPPPLRSTAPAIPPSAPAPAAQESAVLARTAEPTPGGATEAVWSRPFDTSRPR
ncbi:MAG TPA: hypothetical protein VGO00_20340, partial [Kofleriaceae bacterium]|nr:hypothetical protein [Kofleriaceae bacterium]